VTRRPGVRTSGLFVWWVGKIIGLIEKPVISGKVVVVTVLIEALSKSFGFKPLNLSHF
jgi:hypothetical protein